MIYLVTGTAEGPMGEMPFHKEIEAETAGQAEERAMELAQRVADAGLTVRQVTRDPWGSEA